MQQNKQHIVRYCKVCGALVPRRKDYGPKTCEACQKFFRRHFPRRENLVCVNMDSNCSVATATRRNCLKCRMDRCIEAGLKTKKGQTNELGSNGSNSPNPPALSRVASSFSSEEGNHSPEHNHFDVPDSKAVFPIVRDPMLYDGAAIEFSLNSVAKSFTQLHGMEFTPLKIPEQIFKTDKDSLMRMVFQTLCRSTAATIGYCNDVCELEQLHNDKAELLPFAQRFTFYAPTLYTALPNYGNNNPSSSCFGVEHKLQSSFLGHFPGIEEAAFCHSELARHIAQWNPSFIEVAIMFGLLYLDESSLSVTKLARIRRRLWMALNLHQSRVHGHDTRKIAERRMNLENAIRGAMKAATNMQSFLINNVMFPIVNNLIDDIFREKFGAGFNEQMVA